MTEVAKCRKTHAGRDAVDEKDIPIRHEYGVIHQPITRHKLYLPPASNAGIIENHAGTLIGCGSLRRHLRWIQLVIYCRTTAE